MKKIFFIIFILLTGCSQNQIEKKLAKKDIHLVVIDIENRVGRNSTIGYAISENLKNRLEDQKGVTLEKRPKRATFKDEKKLLKKRKGVEYIITGVITNISTKKVEYPERTRSEGGSSAGWIEYRACIWGAIKIFKPPFTQSAKNFTFNHVCIKQNYQNYKEMLIMTAPQVVDEVFYELTKFLVNDGKKYSFTRI